MGWSAHSVKFCDGYRKSLINTERTQKITEFSVSGRVPPLFLPVSVTAERKGNEKKRNETIHRDRPAAPVAPVDKSAS